MKYSKLLACTIAAALVMGGSSPEVEEKVFVRSRYLMGTPVEIKARGDDKRTTQTAINAAYDEIARIEALMSHWRADSELGRINENAGKSPVAVSPELLDLVNRAIGVSRLTGGAFEITVEPLSRLWRIEKDASRIPTEAEIKKSLELVGYRHVQVDDKAGTIFLDSPDARIGLGGIAKGYAVDRAMELLRSRGIRSAMITAGGDMAVLGDDGDHPWRIGIKDPREPDRTIGWFEASDTTVHTSGDYERFIMVNGKRYHHILDPEDGYPALRSRSVTVITPDGTLGDALSTGIFVLGPTKGLRLVESLTNVEALIIDAAGSVHMSAAMHKVVHLGGDDAE